MSGYPQRALFSRAESALETPPPASLKSEGYETKGRERWGKAAWWKLGCQVSGSELLRGITKGGDEPGVGFIELAADTLPKGMKARGGRFLRPEGLGVRILRQDRLTAERFTLLLFPLGTSVRFDPGEQSGNALAVEIIRQSAPAGQRIRIMRFLFGAARGSIGHPTSRRLVSPPSGAP